MLDAFRLKPFDLEPVLASWTDAPKFDGNPKKDLPVGEWLEKVRLGCVERKVPEECWHKVAQHFMGPNARARLDELKAVVAQVNGGKYRWTWSKFKVAMESMGWDIDPKRTETIKVSKGGSWWRLKKKEATTQEEPAVTQPAQPTQPTPAERPAPQRSSSSFWSIKSSSSKGEDTHLPPIPPAYCEEPASIEEVVEPAKAPLAKRVLQRSATDTFWPMKKKDQEDDTDTKGKAVAKMPSDTNLAKASTNNEIVKARTPSRSSTTDSAAVAPVTETKAPVWLLNACTALDFITSEHPKAMSIISAILITAGSIPAIPAISAGAGGAILASSAAHAIGAIAVGLGQAIGTTVKNHQQHEAPASSSTR